MARPTHKRLKRFGIISAITVSLVGMGVIFIASKLGGDEAVLNDIDRHFESLEAGDSYAAFYKEEQRTGGQTAPAPVGSPEAVQVSSDADRTTGAKAKRRSGRKERRKQRRKPTDDEMTQTGGTHPWNGIRKVAAGTYLIDQKLVSIARQRPKSFIRGIKARLVGENGKPIGFQLSGISPSSAIHAIGLRNGDVLLAVNGFTLRTIDEALLAATSLRFADKFRVDIKRGAAKRSLYYRVDQK